MRLTGRDFVLHVAQRARAGERTCWRIEEEQDRIANAAWADWNQGREVRADDMLLQQTNVAAAQTADRTAAPMMCIGRADRDERKRLLLADLSRWAWQGVIEVPVDGTSALLCRLRAAGIFVQKHITIDDQLHPHAIPRPPASAPAAGRDEASIDRRLLPVFSCPSSRRQSADAKFHETS